MYNCIEKSLNLNSLIMVGTSHKLASVEIREFFSPDREDVPALYEKFLDKGFDEVVFLATCNRVEFYLLSPFGKATSEMVWEALNCFTGVSKKHFEDSVNVKYGVDSVRHLMEVTASLDSMVLGENEITGQIRNSFQVARENFAPGPIFKRLFDWALFTSKRVRRETGISKNPLSVASIAIDRVKLIFPDISQRTVLLIGAGEMGELVLKYIMEESPKKLMIANRTRARAEKICRELCSDAMVIPFHELLTAMLLSDIVITSVSSPSHIIERAHVEEIMNVRKEKPLFFIDIAVPRNVDPLCGELGEVHLYNVDSLKGIARINMESRKSELERASKIIDEEVVKFHCWFEELKITPIIKSLKSKFDSIRRSEWEKYNRRKLKHLSRDDQELVNELTVQIMKKTLHNPIMSLKNKNVFSPCEENDKISIERVKLIEDMFLR